MTIEDILQTNNLDSLPDEYKNFFIAIYNKIDDLKEKLNTLSAVDYYAKGVSVKGNELYYNDNPLSVEYAENARYLNGKSYDDFIKDIQNIFNPIIDEYNNKLIEKYNEAPIKVNFESDWHTIDDNLYEKDIFVGVVDSLDFTPSYVEVLAKVSECNKKNGGDNGIITQIPSIGISNNGIPFDGNDLIESDKTSAFWIEDNQIKVIIKKSNLDKQWVGDCKKIEFKTLAWR